METIYDVQDYLQRDSAGLANSVLICPFCNRPHKIPFKVIRIGFGVVHEIPGIAARILGHPPKAAWVIYDCAIEEIIHAGVIQPLTKAGLPFQTLGLGRKGLLLDSDEGILDEAAARIDQNADILIGAGSGVISDITKGIATRLGKPFILCGTAPSMNSYTSITATITENDIKTSKWYTPADAVVMDVELLAHAPMAMIHAGMGDLLARAVCNADWKLASLLHGLYFCPLPYQMTAENERRLLSAAAGIGKADPHAINVLSEAILISGYSMTVLDGETSPSSGAEHILSHFWDLMVHLRNAPKNLHGAQVGVGSIIMLAFYDYVRKIDPAGIDPQALLQNRLTLEQILADNQAHFGDKAVSFNEVARKKYLPDAEFLQFIDLLKTNWTKIWDEVAPYVGDFEAVLQAMKEAGVPVTLREIQRTREDGIEALLYGSRYRTRYTLLDLAWELGIFPAAAGEILTKAGVV
jgi:glycerol-1-phosphate dehydrogenase [NAD(P)+]